MKFCPHSVYRWDPDTMHPVVADPLPKKVESFAGFVCDRCGEMTVEGYGRPLGDKKVCIACYEQAAQER